MAGMIMGKDDMFSKFGETYEPDDILFCEYEPGKDFYILQEGRVKVTKIVSDMEKTLDIFHPGDIFGEMAILETRIYHRKRQIPLPSTAGRKRSLTGAVKR
jgi:CRP-like cAMP-binding protein